MGLELQLECNRAGERVKIGQQDFAGATAPKLEGQTGCDSGAPAGAFAWHEAINFSFCRPGWPNLSAALGNALERGADLRSVEGRNQELRGPPAKTIHDQVCVLDRMQGHHWYLFLTKIGQMSKCGGRLGPYVKKTKVRRVPRKRFEYDRPSGVAGQIECWFNVW